MIYTLRTSHMEKIINYGLMVFIMENAYGIEDLENDIVFFKVASNPDLQMVTLDARDATTGKALSDKLFNISETEFNEYFVSDTLKTLRFKIEQGKRKDGE